MTKTVESQEKMRAMNEALVLGSLRQHELAEASDLLNLQLQKEIAERKQVEAALRDSKAMLDFTLESAQVGDWDLDLITDKALRSLRHDQCFGYREPVAEWGFATFIQHVHPADRADIEQKFRQAVAQQKDWQFECRVIWPDSSVHWVTAHGSIDRTPEGKPTRMLGIVADITERKQAEDVLRKSEAFSQSVFESNSDCVKILDLDGRIERMNVNGQCVMEIDDFGAICGQRWPSLWPPETHAQIDATMAEARAGRTGRFSGFCPTAKGTPKWWDVIVTAIPGADGRPARLVAASRDVTERKEAEQRQSLLTNELAHRGKNLLAVVLSVASRSLSGTRPLSEARDVLIQRLHALARSQSVLIAQGFEGAPLAEIVRLEFESFSDRVKAAGPEVMVNPRVAQTFALLLHELATNASKHGALSGPDGHIAIQWSVEGDGVEARFKFKWQELGGPPVVPSIRQGFGRILLEKAAAQEFGVPPTVSFAPEGLIYEINAPLSLVAAGGGALEGSAGTTTLVIF